MDTYQNNNSRWVALFVAGLMVFGLLMHTNKAEAQDKVKKENLPESVVTAIETDFISCADKISWQSVGDRPDHYVALAKGKNVSCEAVYDKYGRLIRSKTVMSNVKLPAAVHSAIKSEYSGWNITGDQAIVRNFDEDTRYFVINLDKEGETETAYYNSSGQKVSPSGTVEGETAEIAKENVPETVVSAVEADFFSCKEIVEWDLADQQPETDRYAVKAEGENMTCEAVYDKNGKLLHSKTVTQDMKLPAPVLRAITRDYPDWQITGDQAIVRNFRDNRRYFEVYLEKEGESKTEYYNIVGEKIDPKHSRFY